MNKILSLSASLLLFGGSLAFSATNTYPSANPVINIPTNLVTINTNFIAMGMMGTNTVTLAGADTFATVTNFNAVRASGFTYSTNSYATATNLYAGWYLINFDICLASVNGNQIEAAIFTNNVECTLVGSHFSSSGASIYGTASAHFPVYLPAGTYTQLRVKNITAPNNPTVAHSQFSLLPMSFGLGAP